MSLQTDREKTAHLLRRFGLGASEAEVDYYVRDGYRGAVERLLDYDSVKSATYLDPEDLTKDKNNVLPTPLLAGWWAGRMLTTRKPLQEKMALFWHDHFATSAAKVRQSGYMLQHLETLTEHATGNFRDLLFAVSKDPAMLFWLDAQENQSGKPNENFAREVMELFTLGIGNYTERDIQEAARAFTGWAFLPKRPTDGTRIRRAEFLFRPRVHDRGEKTVLGKTGNLSGEDVLHHLCQLPRTSQYLAEKLVDWFVYPNAEPAYVERIAKVLRESNLDIQSAIKSIMLSSEFTSDKAERAVVKTPVDFVIPTLRQLGIGEGVVRAVEGGSDPRIALAPATLAMQSMKNMGMYLLYPPDVAGWDHGTSWITSATVVERLGWADKLFGTGKNRRFGQYPFEALFLGVQTPVQAVQRVSSLLDAPVTQDNMQVLAKAASEHMTGSLDRVKSQALGSAVSRLIFSLPKFQFA
jgi:uncharacterized protein (DUF1800 family)